MAYTPPDYPQCKTHAAAVSLAQRNTSPEAPLSLVPAVPPKTNVELKVDSLLHSAF